MGSDSTKGKRNDILCVLSDKCLYNLNSSQIYNFNHLKIVVKFIKFILLTLSNL